MSSLQQILVQRIATTGPLTLAEYMAEALLHPEHGYYMAQDPLGAAGDFVTAPEISQMFGELLGLCLAQSWLDQGAPAPFILAELGPGRGTLMADILRATRAVPGFHQAARVALVEASPHLRQIQRERLGEVSHYTHPAELPDGPVWLIANEFFDTLPVRQAIRRGDAWCERVLGQKDGQLVLGLSEPAPLAALAPRLADTDEGQMVEWHPALSALIGDLGRRIAQHGGAALIADYGHWDETGDTFQAVRAHQKCDPLSEPGTADLTAHVNFAEIARAAAPALASTMVAQGSLLERLGITARSDALAQGLSGAALDTHLAAYRRLTDARQMGTLFKMIALTPPGQPGLPGFDDPQG